MEVLGNWSNAAASKRRRSKSWVMSAGWRTRVLLGGVWLVGVVGDVGTEIMSIEGCFDWRYVRTG